MMMAFIDAHREDLGIEPICRELAIALPPTMNMLHAVPIPGGVRHVPGAMRRSGSRSSESMKPASASMAHARSGTRCGVTASWWRNARWND